MERMAIPPQFQQQIESITDVWTQHTAQYASARVKLAKQWVKVQFLTQQVTELEQRLARARHELMPRPPAERAADERELNALERDVANDRAEVTASERACKKIARELEATWDIWQR